MSHSFFTSESVAEGHPDKVADQISDAILDACLTQDPNSRVACEVLVCTGLVVIAGEITSKASVDYQGVARATIATIGYTQANIGFDATSCAVIIALNKQSPDIALGVDTNAQKEQGAGDQGLMFGYACNETKELMPLPITLAHAISRALAEKRHANEIPYLRPDGKTQITVEYDSHGEPVRVDAVVISTQHDENTSHAQIVHDMEKLAKSIIPSHLIDAKTRFFINPTGRFVIGGPHGDCGLTGRKTIVDSYGGTGRHGGGAFSGKDPSKVDRSASYAARYVAKNIVAAGLAKRCEIQLAYAIGVPRPVSIKVDTFGTSAVDEALLSKATQHCFDLSAGGIVKMLDLKRPIYLKTASGGHFGRPEPDFTWEKLDKVAALQAYIDETLPLEDDSRKKRQSLLKGITLARSMSV